MWLFLVKRFRNRQKHRETFNCKVVSSSHIMLTVSSTPEEMEALYSVPRSDTSLSCSGDGQFNTDMRCYRCEDQEFAHGTVSSLGKQSARRADDRICFDTVTFVKITSWSSRRGERHVNIYGTTVNFILILSTIASNHKQSTVKFGSSNELRVTSRLFYSCSQLASWWTRFGAKMSSSGVWICLCINEHEVVYLIDYIVLGKFYEE